MATFFELGPQPNIDRDSRKFVVVFLNDPSPNNEGSPEKMKSGLVRISSSKEWHREKKTLKKDLRTWTTVYSQTNDNSPDAQFQMSKLKIELNDVEECFRQIQNYAKNHVLLILSNQHAQNKQLIDRFTRLPQIVRIIQHSPVTSQQQSRRRPFYRNKPSFLKILPKQIYNTPIEDFDEPMKLLLIEIFLEDILTKIETSCEARQDFIKYCRAVYHNQPNRLEQISEFDRDYDGNNPIYWYTRSNTFIYRIVSKVFASLNIESLFNIRLIPCDLYQQLKELHETQLDQLRQTGLTVHRGALMSRNELNVLNNKGKLCVTRPFLSVTIDEVVARFYSGHGSTNEEQIPVIITMTIDSQQIEGSVLARIGQVSAHSDEQEVMLFRGLVFRIESYKEDGNGPTHLVRIEMVRGEDEVKIETCLREKYRLMTIGATSPLLGLLGLLKLTEHHPNVEGQPSQIFNNLQSSNPQIGKHFSSPGNIDNQPIHEYHNLELLQNQEPPCHTAIELGEHLTGQNELVENANVPASGGVAPNPTTQIAFIAKIAAVTSNMSNLTIIGLITVVAVVVIIAVAVPLGILLTAHKNTTEIDTAKSCRTSFTFLPSVQNPSANYQVEHLNISCSQTLINMSIILIVQRNYNETYAQHYQTFWNQSTNITYVETPLQIIYHWFSLPGMHIVWNSFPHFIEAQFYYTPGSTRATSNDMWMVSSTTSCGENLNFSGTF